MNNETVKGEVLRQHPEISGQYGDAQHLVHTATGYNALKTGGDALLAVGLGKASKKLKKIAEEEKKQKKEGEL